MLYLRQDTLSGVRAVLDSSLVLLREYFLTGNPLSHVISSKLIFSKNFKEKQERVEHFYDTLFENPHDIPKGLRSVGCERKIVSVTQYTIIKEIVAVLTFIIVQAADLG